MSLSKNLLTNCLTGLYSNPSLPHCKFGNSSPVNHDAQPRPYAVFLCVLHSYICVMMDYVGTSKDVPVRDTGLLPRIVRHPSLAGFGDGFKTPYHESAIMQNTSLTQVRPFAFGMSQNG